MGGLPSEEFFGNLMTWSALEDAVRGLRDTTTPAAVVEKTEASNQTDPVSTARVRERGVNKTRTRAIAASPNAELRR